MAGVGRQGTLFRGRENYGGELPQVAKELRGRDDEEGTSEGETVAEHSTESLFLASTC